MTSSKMYSRCNELKSVQKKTLLKYGVGMSQSRAVMWLSNGMNSFISILLTGFVGQGWFWEAWGTPQESFSRLGNRIEENKNRFQFQCEITPTCQVIWHQNAPCVSLSNHLILKPYPMHNHVSQQYINPLHTTHSPAAYDTSDTLVSPHLLCRQYMLRTINPVLGNWWICVYQLEAEDLLSYVATIQWESHDLQVTYR